ncbi:MAG: M28 family peptidase [Acidobacteria bacterium]|nr:M28 family peptidase [Acidobacteriota bacterium]
MKRVVAVLVLLGAGSSIAAAQQPRLTGFTPARSTWQRDYERKLLPLPQPAECDALLRELTRTPHVAGTPGNARVHKLIADEFRKAGLTVETPTYDVLLSYPKRGTLDIVGEPAVALARREEPIPEDLDSANPEVAGPWIAYGSNCDLTAEVVYVNRGSAADYEELARRGIDVRGKIALARYFGGYRGGKSLEAEKRGVAALLVFSDPIDDGWFQGGVYPKGPWGPSSHFQRGANVYDFNIPGDPLTPGWASVAGAKRIPESEATTLPKMPMMPLSARDAAEILARLGGNPVAEGWQGVAIADTYRTGPGPVKLHLVIENTREVRTIANVIGTLRGTDFPDEIVLLSNHNDAWEYGAVDPSSGTATLIALARAFGKLAAEGWKPRRTIVFGSWDAEEYTLTGSTEWGEQHETNLRKNAVVCINVDASTSGPYFTASASPLMFDVVRAVAGDVPDPGAPGKSVGQTWREKAGGANIRGYGAASAEASDQPISILGSGSDYTVFFNKLGIPSVDLVFDGPYGVYHSVYDSYHWMATEGDPGFKYHVAMANYAGVLALRFANADAIPLDGSAYGTEIAGYVDDVASLPAAAKVAKELADLKAAALAWSTAAAKRQQSIDALIASGKFSADDAKAANVWLMSLERALLAEEGLPDRFWFRHLVYAPLPSYAAETLPGIREAIVAGRDPRPQIELLAAKLRTATAAANAR